MGIPSDFIVLIGIALAAALIVADHDSSIDGT